ncbi:MAG: hypothetical protein ACI9IP_001435 [Arcticibacterium sp.]|jgi:hypothetical protein
MNLAFAFISLFMLSSADVPTVMREFHDLNSEKQESLFLKNYTSSTNPSVLAYVVTLEIKQAEYAFSPLKKYNIFQAGKDKLDKLVTQNPENIHLRYMRYLIQKRTPSFLGYNTFLDEDERKLKSYLASSIDSDSLRMSIRKNCSL